MLKLLISMPILGIIFMRKTKWSREIGMLFSIITMYISLYILLTTNNNNIEYQYRESIELSGMRIGIGIDGISLSLIIVTTILIPILILIKERKDEEEQVKIVKILLIIESMLIMLFTSLDIFIFFIMFELLLIPMFILIGRYGSKEKRVEAGYRFLIVSLVGSLIMLLSIIILYIKYGSTNNEILMVKLINENENLMKILWLSLFISFAIKVPIFPFHTWLPFVHVEAPTIGSMLLAGIMLKLGTYGIIRYTINMYVEISTYYMPLIIIMSVLSIIYGSLSTIRQIDLKKIIAYSSIVHMNYAIIGYYTNEIEGIQGSNYLMISHAFVSSGLFLLIGILYKRYHTRILLYYKGIVLTMPLYATMFLLFTLANVSLPLTSSFISEILIIISTIKMNLYIGILISISLILTTTYGMWLANRLLFGQISSYLNYFVDLTYNETLSLLPLLLLTVLLGISTQPLLSLYTLSVTNLLI